MKKSVKNSNVIRLSKNYSNKKLLKKFLPLISTHLGNALNFEVGIDEHSNEIITMKEVYKFDYIKDKDCYVLELNRNSDKSYYLIEDRFINDVTQLRQTCYIDNTILESEELGIELPTSYISTESDKILIKELGMLQIPITSIISDGSSYYRSLQFMNFDENNKHNVFGLRSIPILKSLSNPIEWDCGFGLMDPVKLCNTSFETITENNFKFINIDLHIHCNLIDDVLLVCIGAYSSNPKTIYPSRCNVFPLKINKNGCKETTIDKVINYSNIRGFICDVKFGLANMINGFLH